MFSTLFQWFYAYFLCVFICELFYRVCLSFCYLIIVFFFSHSCSNSFIRNEQKSRKLSMFLANCFWWMYHNDVSLYFSFNKLMNCHWFRWFFLMNVLLYDDNCTTRLCGYVHVHCVFNFITFILLNIYLFCVVFTYFCVVLTF